MPSTLALAMMLDYPHNERQFRKESPAAHCNSMPGRQRVVNSLVLPLFGSPTE